MRRTGFWNDVQRVGGDGIKRAPLIVVMMLGAALLDLIGVALIAPFLGLIIGDTRLLGLFPETIRQILGPDPMVRLGVLLVVLFAIKALATLLLQRAITRLSESIRADLMGRLLAAYQRHSYEWFLACNSGDLVNKVIWHSQTFSNGFIGAILRLASDSMVFIALGGLILWTDWRAFVLLVLLLGSAGFVTQELVRRRAKTAVRAQAQLNADVIKSVHQSLGGLREIRILGCETYFLSRMIKAARGMVETSARLAVIHIIPRQAIEFTVVLFLVVLVFVTRRDGADMQSLLPLLGVIGASAVRLMPASTSLLTNFNSLRMNRQIAAGLAADLLGDDQPSDGQTNQPAIQAIGALRSVRAEKISFAYAGANKDVFTDFDFEIYAGEVVGLIGSSGAGKSTLADLLLGLIEPTRGQILINGQPLPEVRRAWQAHVAYIPQAPYLLDDTLRRNVALGVADAQIDDTRVLGAISDARLGVFLDGLDEGLDTTLGERGVRMSGGQRQRVSIARALYHDREFLVLDEATSALDEATELEVLETIRGLIGRKTILIIAHRESTLACCTRRVRLGSARPAPT